MNSMKCIGHYMDVNKKLRKAIMFGAVAAGAYIGTRKILGIIEDKRLARYYEDEIEEIFKEKEKMQFYEDEFIRQEKEEEEELEKAVDKFNSRRLRREDCPHCSENKPRVKRASYRRNDEYDG